MPKSQIIDATDWTLLSDRFQMLTWKSVLPVVTLCSTLIAGVLFSAQFLMA